MSEAVLIFTCQLGLARTLCFDNLCNLQYRDPAFSPNMNPVSKKNVAAEVHAELRRACLAGRWGERLPGVRILAAQLNVSPPTVLKALHKLTVEGILISSGARRAYRICQEVSLDEKPRKDRKTRQVVLLTHRPIEELVETTRQIIEELQKHLAANGWQMRRLVVNFFHAKSTHQSWDEIIGTSPDVPVIAVYGRAPIANWALKNNLRIMFLGGELIAGTSRVLVDSVKMAEEMFARLVALGHREILLPICDRAEPYSTRLREVTKAAIEATGASYSVKRHNAGSTYNMPAVIYGIVQAALKSHTPPTAMILLDWKELIAAHCCMAELGLKAPDDISLTLLNDQPDAKWFQPSLARYQFPIGDYAKTILKWLEMAPEETCNVVLEAEFLAGNSIAVPKNQ